MRNGRKIGRRTKTQSPYIQLRVNDYDHLVSKKLEVYREFFTKVPMHDLYRMIVLNGTDILDQKIEMLQKAKIKSENLKSIPDLF